MGDLIIEKTISGDTVTFQSRIAAPIKSLRVDIMPIQSGSGDPNPTNIRPLTGNDHVTICVCPKNMVTDGNEINMDTRGIHLQVQANRQRVVINGTATRAVNGTSFTLAENLNPSVLHYLYNVPVTGGNIWSFRGTQNRYININGIGYSPTNGYIGLGFWLSTGDTINVDFSPIVSDKPPIVVNIPEEIGTVYGGTLDVISGELIVDTIKIAVDGSANWTMLSPGIYSLLGSIDNACVNTKLSKYRSNMYPFRGTGETKSSGLDKDGYFYIQSSVDRIWVYDSNYSTLADFKTFLNENPLELTYPTTATTTYQLPATEIKTLLTTNIITSDAGAVTVTYDDKEYTDLIASRRRMLMETPHDISISGGVASFKTNMAAKLKNFTVNIEPVQEGSGDPSPDNVRTISGWTGCNVTKCGKNLFDINWLESTNKVSIYDGVASGTAYNFHMAHSKDGIQATKLLYKTAPMVLSLYAYTDGNDTTDGTGIQFDVIYLDGTYSRINVPNRTTTDTKFTLNVNDKPIDVLRITYGKSSANIWHVSKVQLEVGSTATEFEPYNSSTVNIDWTNEAGTIYGGMLDVITGVLTVDRAMVDLGTLSYAWYTDARFDTGGAFMVTLTRYNGIGYILSDIYACYPNTSLTSIFNAIGSGADNLIISYGSKIYIINSSYNSVADFKTAMSGIQLVYELATPQTYQLTPTQVKTLLGNNTIYADTGDVELTYWKH